MSAAVLVGTNLGPGADEAVRQANRWSLERKARLIVCHVVPSPVRLNLLFPQLNIQLTEHAFEIQRIAELVERRVVALTRQAPDELEVLVEDGLPEEVLVRHAEASHAELIVVGASTNSAIGRLLGGVAECVVRYARVPVLVARRSIAAGRVLIATDLSDPSLPALAAAVKEAERRHAQLHVVHCIPPRLGGTSGAYPGMIGAPLYAPNLDSVWEELAREARHNIEVGLQRFAATAELHVLRGDPGSAITELADELRPELLVVGSAGNTGLRRLALGSVAEQVVRYAKHPTLVVRLAGSHERWARDTRLHTS